MSIKYFFIIILCFIVFSGFSQKSEEQEELIEVAADLFDSGEYKKAMPLYSQLLSIYPSEPIYSFYYGACLVENNKEINKAIKYLVYASKKLSDKPLAYFYLGSAYHLSYQFDKSIEQYQLFQSKSAAKLQKEKQVDRQISICNNGLDLVKYVSQLTVLDNKKINQNNFQYSYDLKQIGGKLVVKPDLFKTKVDLKQKAKELIFISDSGKVFFSSLGDQKNGDRNIYWTEKDMAGEFLPSKNIGEVINTPYDEDYPFLKADGKTLYFCSKGHNTMGGYDIFKSVYDSVAKGWTKPVNLDFPTNTPYDDLLYVVDRDDNLAFFASNRESQENKLNVYKIQVDKNPIERTVTSVEEIQQIAKLNITPLADRPKEEDVEQVVATTEIAEYKSEGPKTNFSFDEVYESNVSGSGDYTGILRRDLLQLKINLKKTEAKRNIATNIAHNKLGKLRELQSQIETRQAANTLEELQDNQEYIDLVNQSVKTNTQAYISAKTSEALTKELELRKREVKITEMLLNDSANNNKQELVQNINANRKFLEQNNKTYLSIQNWTREKEREKVLVEQKVGQKQQNYEKKNVKFEQALVDYKQAERELEKAKEVSEITKAKESLDLLKEDLQIAQAEVIDSKIVFSEELAVVRRMDQEIIFLNTINSELIDKQNQGLANDKTFDQKLIVKNAETFNETVLEIQSESAELIAQTKYEEKTSDIFNAQEELLAENVKESEATSMEETPSIENTEEIKENSTVSSGNSEQSTEIQKAVVPIVVDTETTEDGNVAEPQIKTAVSTPLTPSEVKSTKVEISKVDLVQVYSLEARIKYSNAKINAQLSDSLQSLVNEKESRVNFIPNTEQQEIVKDEIEELKSLSKIKANQSVLAYKEAQVIEQEFVTKYEPDTVVETLIKQKVFAFESSEIESPELIEYKKAAFKEQYFQQELSQLETKKSATEKTLDGEDITEEIREQFQADLAYQIKKEKKMQIIIANAKETQLKMKAVLVARHETYPVSKEEVYAAATEKQLSDNIELSKDQKETISKITDDRNKAKDLKILWIAKVDEITKLEDSLLILDDKANSSKLLSEVNDKKAEAWGNYKKVNELQQFANMEEANMLSSLLDINRKYQQSEESSQAYVFEKESELLLKKSGDLRESVQPSEVYDPTVVKILDKAQLYETIAVNRKKSALDIYASLPADKPIETIIVQEGLAENVFDSGAVIVELSPDEEEKMAKYQKLYSQSESKQIKAESYFEDVEESKVKLDRTFAKKDKEKLKTKIEKQEFKAKLAFHDAYLIQKNANKKKHDLYTRKIESAIKTSSDKTRKAMANQYLLDADFYYKESQNVKVDSTIGLNELKAQHNKVLDFEKEAIKAQELAFLTLTKQENTDFLTMGSLVKIDPLESNEKPIDKELIQKVQSQRILNRLELTSQEAKQLSKAEQLKDDKNKLTSEYLENKAVITELNDSLPKVKDPKQWKKVDAEISKLDAKSLAYLFSIAQTTEPINYDKFMVYKNHIRGYRIKGRSEEAVTGRTLEKDANKAFRKAQNLRARSFEVVSVDRAYEMLEQAEVLEDEALEVMEKAYTVYMKLGPIEDDVEKYIAENTDTNKVGVHGNILVESDAEVEAFETPETVVNVKSETITEVTPKTAPEVSAEGTALIVGLNTDIKTDSTETVEILVSEIDTIAEEKIVLEEEIAEVTAEVEPEEPAFIEEIAIEEPSKQPTKLVATNTSAILAFNAGSVYNKTNPIPVDEALPNGLVYKIQIGAFTKPIPQNSFRGLTPITGETRQSSKYIRYFVGLFNTYDAANTALPYVKKSGYKDAFVVAYKDGQRVAVYLAKKENKKQDNYQELARIETASVLEIVNKNSEKSKASSIVNVVNPSVDIKELTGALYTVQVGAYKTHVSHSRLKNLTPLYNDVTSSGLIRYFVGQFVDFNEANKRKLEIRKAGIKDAFVTAFKNGKKISVNQARKELASITSANLQENSQENSSETITETTPVVTTDTKPNTISPIKINNESLYYRVQIGAYSNTVPVEVVSSFVQMSKLDQLDRYVNPEGKTIYTIGRFKSLSRANILKQDLVEQGITDAFIIAFDGQQKITIEEARKILQP